MDMRLLLVSHAATAAQRAGRIPADEPLDACSLAEAEATRSRIATSLPDSVDASVFVSPAVCARDTATTLGLSATVVDALADMNYGDWQGQRLADLAAQAPQELAAWTRDAYIAPPGGESFNQVVQRIGKWLDALASDKRDEAASSGQNDSTHDSTHDSARRSSNRPHTVVAITHAPVLRAAIV